MVDAAPVHVAIERQLHRVGVADGVGGRVGWRLNTPLTGFNDVARARLSLLAVAAVGVGQRAFPTLVERLIDLQSDAVLIAAGGVIGFVETAIARRIHRFCRCANR